MIAGVWAASTEPSEVPEPNVALDPRTVAWTVQLPSGPHTCQETPWSPAASAAIMTPDASAPAEDRRRTPGLEPTSAARTSEWKLPPRSYQLSTHAAVAPEPRRAMLSSSILCPAATVSRVLTRRGAPER